MIRKIIRLGDPLLCRQLLLLLFSSSTKLLPVPQIPFHISHRWLNPLLAMIIALTPFAIDTYLPALATIASDLSVDLHKIELSVSSYFLGYALGMLFGGPLSDRIGRRLIGLSGFSVFIICSLLIANINDADQMVVVGGDDLRAILRRIEEMQRVGITALFGFADGT